MIEMIKPLRMGNAEPIDTERIKQDVDLRTIAESYTTLRRESVYSLAGPCPKCGGDDRFCVKADKFSCRKCHPKWGDAIEFMTWVEGCTFKEAAARLTGQALPTTTPTHRRQPERRQPEKQEDKWKSAQWQAEAQRKLSDYNGAQDTLWNLPAGEPGRAYLTERGIRPDMWIAFGLGYGEAWNNKAGKMWPALWIPWQNRQITAIQYRFLDVAKEDKTASRYEQLPGGVRYLFGLQHCMEADPGQLHTLFLVEGELNAVSIFQCIYGQYPCDVVSYGPQSNITNKEVASLAARVAKRYRRVILWADEPATAQDAMGIMPDGVTVIPVRSPVRDEHKHDANYLLQQGQLDDLVYKLIRKASTA